MSKPPAAADRRSFMRIATAVSALGLLPYAARRALAESPVTIGFIYVGARDDFGYNQAHAQAAAALKKVAGVKLVEEEKVPETVAVQKSMEAMIVQDKAAVVFATSFGYFDPHVLKVAQKHPEAHIAHCGGLWQQGKHPSNVASYFGYIDECQYLNGVVAGASSKTGKLGFVAAKPIPQVLRNINAFTLGARSMNPAATTRVIFTGDWSMPVKEAEATNSLLDQGCDVITCHVDGPKVVIETAEKRGAMTCGYHASQAKLAPKGYLTGAEWDWVTPCTEFVRAAQAGKPLPNFVRGGLREGFVKMSPYGSAAAEKGRNAADAVRQKMLADAFVIFKGPLVDNTGKEVVAAGVSHVQTAIELESMNYLVDGVIGKA